MEATERKRSPGLTVILGLMAIVYLLAAPYLLTVWMGIQSVPYNLLIPKELLAIYALAFAVGGIGVIAILKWKKWGVYALGACWIAVWGLSLLAFPSSRLVFSGVSSAIVLIILIRPIWQFLT